MPTNSTPKRIEYTTSSVILASLASLGVTHAFVNWGSDHPALLEDLARQVRNNGKHDLKIITCPNEMVALSAAQGYAQVSATFGKTQRVAAVLVHVDVGTQALSCAVHNADRGRIPVLIYAGAAPYSLSGELRGSRNEFIMWLQDIHDQSEVVRQYTRYSAQISSGKNTSQVIRRALQIATSEPKGPTYLWARREVTEEEVDEATMQACSKVGRSGIGSVEPVALSPHAANTIANALLTAVSPLIITSYLGRNPAAVPLLVELSESLAIPVYLSCPWTVSFPRSHQNFAGCSFGMGENAWLREADVVLILDCDVPWVPVHNRPKEDARIFHVDVDVLKTGIGMWDVEAEMRCRADSEVALKQIIDVVANSKPLAESEIMARIQSREIQLDSNFARISATFADIESTLPTDGSFTVPNLLRTLRECAPPNTLFLNESVSNYPLAWSHLQPDEPGSMIASGSSALGWGLGAAIGAGLAIKEANSIKANPSIQNGSPRKIHNLVVLVVGDGSFLFGAPSSAYWIAQKYETPFLTIVLNNGGWKSPKLSHLAVFPSGHGSNFIGDDLTVGFGPTPPDYAGIAAAAGGSWGKEVSQAVELEQAIREGIRVVTEERRCAVLDCVLERI